MTSSAADTRPARASAAEMKRLLTPRSIAIVGASSDPTKFSGRFVPYLVRHSYPGQIYPINARRAEICGIACYADLASIPGEVDCVIYAAAAADVEQTLAACADKKVKLIVVTSAGFAERGDEEGAQLQARMLKAARGAGVRVLGPNCVGFLNAPGHIAAAAAAAFEWQPPMPQGHVGVVSQSGGLGLGTIVLGGFIEGIGFSHIVTSGNEADLDVVDFARFLLQDDDTDAICLTLEAVRDGPGFLQVLEEAQRIGKPVIAIKTGQSDLGKEMAASHTGALAGSHAVFAAVAARYGVCLVDDIDELYQTGTMFAKLRRAGKLEPKAAQRFVGEGCTSQSVSGGHIGLLADLAAMRGMKFPHLSNDTQALLAERLGKTGSIANPVDMSGGSVSDPGTWARCLDALLRDPAVTVALPILTAARNYDSVRDDLVRLSQAQDKPIIVTWAGDAFEGERKLGMQKSVLPFFNSPGRTVRGLVALDAWQRARAVPKPTLAAAAAQAASPHPLVLAARAAGRTSLTERESKQVLAELGFPVTRERLAQSAQQAREFAQELGFPVALKGEHEGIAHKSEAGLVKLHLRTGDEVAAAYAHIQERMAAWAPGQPGNGVLVQEMVQASAEFVVGISTDPVFGPMLMFGLGGVFVEVLQDVALAPAPLSIEEAHALIGRVRCAQLLRGARGRAPVDLDRLAKLLVALGGFAAANAGLVREIDINPLAAIDRTGDNLRVLDALIVLHAPSKS